jgi:hypothetical protein
MLKQIFQTLFLCLVVIILTTDLALSNPLPNVILIAQNSVDISKAAKTASSPPPKNTSNNPQLKLKGNLEANVEKDQPMQADPSVGYDPYDFDAIRKMDREIYGEAKGRE